MVGAEPKVKRNGDRGGEEVGRGPSCTRDEIPVCARDKRMSRESELIDEKNDEKGKPSPFEDPSGDGAARQSGKRRSHECVAERSSKNEQDRRTKRNHCPHDSFQHCAPNA